MALDDPISKYVDGVSNGANITIRQLLDMTADLFNTTESVALNKILDEQPHKVGTPDEVLSYAYAEKPYFAPGDGFHYSNTDYGLLSLAAEKAGGKPLAEQPDKQATLIVLANLQLAPNIYLSDGLPADTVAEIIQKEVLPS